MTYLQPLLPALLLLGLVQIVRYRRSIKLPGFRGLTLVVMALFLACWQPAAWLFSRGLEGWYPPRPYPAEDAGAIVVLAASVYQPDPPLPIARVGSDTYERCLYAAWLHRHWKPLPVLVSGGGGFVESPPYAIAMKDVLESEGVPSAAIWVEGRSHSTHENAVYTAQLLQQKGVHRIVLVTNAYHMMRAAACFRKESLTVIPAACGYRTYHDFQLADLLPGWEPISWNEDAMHESVGLVWYRLNGWI
ncbi:MAG: YdcF family protein [Bryobacteraceae bacterium]|jgi:uncharacterized SAM-binding protein YcdF (DUF218 family)